MSIFGFKQSEQLSPLRRAAVAGAFYPSHAATLREAV